MNTRIATYRSACAAVLVAAALALFTRCDVVDVPPNDALVVEAFVRSGEPVPPITLRKTYSLRAPVPDSTQEGARGAEIVLTLEGQQIGYVPAGDRPGRYVPEQSVSIPARASFAVDVRWNGHRARATGRTPPPVEIDEVEIEAPSAPVEAILVDSLRRDSLDIPAEVGWLYPVEATITWTTDFEEVGADSAYWIRTELKPVTAFSSTVVDFFLQPEEVFRERDFPRDNGERRWTGVYGVPVDEPDDPLPVHDLKVALLRSGPDYASFATTRNDPDRREPLSNVEGGLGVVAGIALDTVRVRVDGAQVRPGG